MGRIKFIGKYIGLPLLLIVLTAFATSLFLIRQSKSLNDDANWFASPRGIDEAGMVMIGGINQYVRIRGRDAANPVMLDLHGGPGSPQTGWAYRNLRPMTEYFTLVEWDQRGTSRSPDKTPTENSYARMVDDTIELIEHLQTRLGVGKVTLVGHSWGSMLGLGVVKKRPDLIAAYVGVGQALAWNAGFAETKRLLLEAATKAQDRDTLETLSSQPDSFPPKDDVDGFMEYISVIQAPLVPYGKSIHASKSNNLFASDIVLDLMASPEISISGALDMSNLSASIKSLIRDLYGRDFRQEFGTDYEVPMFIFQGDHDWQTPLTLVRPWFETLQAPHKDYITFEHSAHIVVNEQPGKYLHEMVTRVRPFSLR